MIMTFARTLLILLVSSVSSISFACPAFLGAKEVQSTLKSANTLRSQMRLFTIQDSQIDDKTVTRWEEKPVQVEPLNEENLLILDEKNPPTTFPVAANDRIVMRVEDFGAKLSDQKNAPCHAENVYEIKNSKNQFAYLAACRSNQPFLGRPVIHTPKDRMINASLYRYQYLPNNQLMYEKLIATDPATKKEFVGAANSNMILHLDIKKFFTMDFNNDDVNSMITGSYEGSVGTLSNISFFLKLMFFKIDLKMDTSVAFYGDSGLIPTKFEAPMEDILHPGSGMLYNWQTAQSKIDHERTRKTLPYADPKLILSGPEKLAKAGLKHCDKDCTFRLQGSLGSSPFSLDINLDRYMVEKGFFPIFVSDLKQFAAEMEWDLDEEPPANTIAIYFENSGLPKGFHHMRQWIRMGEASNSDTCPRKVEITRQVSLAPPGIAH
jgi:hypothetical protein